MYLIRRVYDVKPGMAVKVAQVLANVAKIYEKSGQRAPLKFISMEALSPGIKMLFIWNGKMSRSCHPTAKVTKFHQKFLKLVGRYGNT